MRAGQDFSMRYPLIDVNGNGGTLISSDSWSAPRYTESRLSKISNLLFSDIEKDTIDEWRDSYDNTKQYPAVLPSKGFYNIVNGAMGIGIGMATSIPTFNLTEVNNALITLLNNPDASFDEIYCAPDFPTGGYLLNEAEVKESLKNGVGNACKIRAKVEYNKDENAFVVTEIPYSVYTNTICAELDKIIDDEPNNPGIERYNDLTGKTPLIKIYLTKRARPNNVIKYLYKNTSLQSYYGINMMMLEDGRYPRLYTWKEALEAHLDHEIIVYRRGFQYDLNKIEKRIHIVEALIKACTNIDAVIKVIKESNSAASAAQELCTLLEIDTVQAKAILEIKLAKLTRLEINKLENELADLTKKAERLRNILNDESLLKDEVRKGLEEVRDKFGDARRTEILNIEEENEEPQEIYSLTLNLTNKNNIFVNEVNSLYQSRRGTAGAKFKLGKDGEYVISSISVKSNESLLFFSDTGLYYSLYAGILDVDKKISLHSLLPIESDEKICAVAAYNAFKPQQYIFFLTRKGYLKKSDFSEYHLSKTKGVKALTLIPDDHIISIMFGDSEKIGIVTKNGRFLLTDTTDVNPIGRTTRGIKAIKLSDDDEVVAGALVPSSYKSIVMVTKNGQVKQVMKDEFRIGRKNSPGMRFHKVINDDYIIGFTPIEKETELLITATNSQIRLRIDDIPTRSKSAAGVRSIKLGNGASIVGISKLQ